VGGLCLCAEQHRFYSADWKSCGCIRKANAFHCVTSTFLTIVSCRRPVVLISITFFAVGSALAGASQNMASEILICNLTYSQRPFPQPMMIAARGMRLISIL